MSPGSPTFGSNVLVMYVSIVIRNFGSPELTKFYEVVVKHDTEFVSDARDMISN